jgi:hypothetical protein
MDRWLLIVMVKFDDEILEGSDWLKFFGQSSFSKGHFLRAWDLTHFGILFEIWREIKKKNKINEQKCKFSQREKSLNILIAPPNFHESQASKISFSPNFFCNIKDY